MRFVPELDNLARYLEDTAVVDWMTPPVEEKARMLTESCGNDRERVERLFAFVRDEIGRSEHGTTVVLTCRASEVLREGEGLCHARCHLLVALLRARGIPAGFGYQRLRRRPPEAGFVLHGFVGVHLGEAGSGRWIALDPHGDRALTPPRLDLEAPRFATAPDPEAGEAIREVIRPRPHETVVDVLSRAESLEQARRALPGDF